MTNEKQDLLNWTPTPTERFGATFISAFDFDRLNAQELRVFQAMKCGTWRTLREIAVITGDPEASISARLRDLENIHGLTKLKRRRGPETRGLYEYRIDPASIPGAGQEQEH